jgi:MFS transporter, DHA1 family, tetracycline resistance protein
MQKPASSSKRTLLIVFFTIFLDLVGFGIIIPIQPFFAERLGASPTVVTLLGGSFSLMQFLFASVWGRLSDRVGRRPVMLLSISTTAIGYLWFGVAESLWMLFAARMLAGFGSANIGTAQAIIADSTTPETRAKGMGIIGAAFGLGFILGPALGAFFGQFGLSVPAFAAAALSSLNFILAIFILPETFPPEKRGVSTHSHRPGFDWKSLKHVARHVNVSQIFLVYLVYSIAFALMEQSLGLFIDRAFLETSGLAADPRARRAAALTGYYLIIVGITATIIQGGLIGRLARHFGERRLLIFGAFLIGLSFFLTAPVGFLGVFPLMFFVAACTASGTGLLNPSLSSLLSRSVNADEQGTALGIGQSLGALGRIIGPAFAGAIFERHIGLPFYVGGALMIVCVGIARTVKLSGPPSQMA